MKRYIASATSTKIIDNYSDLINKITSIINSYDGTFKPARFDPTDFPYYFKNNTIGYVTFKGKDDGQVIIYISVDGDYLRCDVNPNVMHYIEITPDSNIDDIITTEAEKLQNQLDFAKDICILNISLGSSNLNSGDSGSSSSVDKNTQDEEIERIKNRLEDIFEINDFGDFVEIIGEIGGDTETYRVYKDGSVYAE